MVQSASAASTPRHMIRTFGTHEAPPSFLVPLPAGPSTVQLEPYPPRNHTLRTAAEALYGRQPQLGVCSKLSRAECPISPHLQGEHTGAPHATCCTNRTSFLGCGTAQALSAHHRRSGVGCALLRYSRALFRGTRTRKPCLLLVRRRAPYNRSEIDVDWQHHLI